MLPVYFKLALTIGGVVGAVYFYLRANKTFEHRYNEQQPVNEESQRRKKCIICNKPVGSSHKIYNNSCHCLAHAGCMSLIIKEGQNVCPGCKESLNIRGDTRENGNFFPTNSSRSFGGTSTTRRFS